MNGGTELQPFTPSPADILAALQRIAAAPDNVGLAAILHDAVVHLLPETRIDLFVLSRSTERLLITCGKQDLPSPPVMHSVPSFIAWLKQYGYQAHVAPVMVASQPQGRLVASQRTAGVSQHVLTIVDQLAPVVGLWLMAHRHLTEREAIEEQLRATQERLRQIEEMRLRATLAAGAAHDIGNLFASVLGHAQLLQQMAPPNLQDDLKTIEQAARDGHYLLRRLLTIRSTTSSSEATTSPVLLPALVHDALRLTQPFWGTRRSITVKIALAPVPPVRGHPADLREVLINLILNGVSAMPEGGTLTVRTYSTGERAIVEISDTGVGIAPAHQGVIFQPFVTTRETGSGLGLSVSRMLVERYGGAISVSSAPGRGATFSISLPLAHTDDVKPESSALPCTAS
ncbi:MAG: HAMP domain-containing sensor histidine kinase [Roseiflexaceae bacterium]|nr:HAMP domain-containing histidine kinase [Roseiflexus sp.]MDW8212676.1 HAMP domain-containing sensor histidine kinase [Roseiflexaceae bacterium]